MVALVLCCIDSFPAECPTSKVPFSLYVEKIEFTSERTEAFDRLLTEDVCI